MKLIKLITFIFFFQSQLNAQPVDPPSDDDPAPSSIDNYILLSIVSVISGTYFLTKSKKLTNNKEI